MRPRRSRRKSRMISARRISSAWPRLSATSRGPRRRTASTRRRGRPEQPQGHEQGVGLLLIGQRRSFSRVEDQHRRGDVANTGAIRRHPEVLPSASFRGWLDAELPGGTYRRRRCSLPPTKQVVHGPSLHPAAELVQRASQSPVASPACSCRRARAATHFQAGSRRRATAPGGLDDGDAGRRRRCHPPRAGATAGLGDRIPTAHACSSPGSTRGGWRRRRCPAGAGQKLELVEPPVAVLGHGPAVDDQQQRPNASAAAAEPRRA